jgi:hypothetical protein
MTFRPSAPAQFSAVVDTGTVTWFSALTRSRLNDMYPTTAGIATLAVFQLGIIVLLRPKLSSWLQRRRV